MNFYKNFNSNNNEASDRYHHHVYIVLPIVFSVYEGCALMIG